MKRFLSAIALLFLAPQIVIAEPKEFTPGDANKPYDYTPGDASKPNDFKPADSQDFTPGDADEPYDYTPGTFDFKPANPHE